MSERLSETVRNREFRINGFRRLRHVRIGRIDPPNADIQDRRDQDDGQRNRPGDEQPELAFLLLAPLIQIGKRVVRRPEFATLLLGPWREQVKNLQ